MKSLARGALVVALSALVTTAATAQKTTRLGPIGGVNISNLSGDGFDADSKAGLALGGFVSFGMSPTVAIESGLLYSQRGAKESQVGVDLAIKLNYIELPILAVVRFPGSSSVTPFIGGGAAVSFKAGCSFKVSGGPVSLSGGCDDVEDELGTGLKSTDVGLVGQAGIEINDFRVLARYNLGMSSIVDTPSGISGIKHRTLSLLVGYAFSLR